MKFLLLCSDGATQQIYTVDQDGKRRTLSPMGATPSWTDEGGMVYAGLGDGRIWLADENGDNPRSVLPWKLAGQVVKPQLQNGELCWRAPDTSANAIWLAHADGTGAYAVVQDAEAPFLAPSGKWLTFTKRDAQAQKQIWRINTDGSGLQQLTFYAADEAHPNGNASAISPDEQTVALFWGLESPGPNAPYVKGHRDLAIMPARGGTPKVIVASAYIDDPGLLPHGVPLVCDNPAFDPTGGFILYDWGTEYPAEGGTHMIGVAGDRLLTTAARGAGNNALRWVP